MQALAQQILAGQRRALAKGITLVESTKAVHRLDAAALLSKVMSATGGALRIGISGAPGVGKSTFIEALGRYLNQPRPSGRGPRGRSNLRCHRRLDFGR